MKTAIFFGAALAALTAPSFALAANQWWTIKMGEYDSNYHGYPPVACERSESPAESYDESARVEAEVGSGKKPTISDAGSDAAVVTTPGLGGSWIELTFYRNQDACLRELHAQQNAIQHKLDNYR
jgi:hypothetical protein